MMAVRGTPVNVNGTATGTATRIQAPVPKGRTLAGTPIAPATTFARYLRISNTDAANSLLVSFLDDMHVTILKGTSQEFFGTFPFFTVQSSSTSTTWEAHCVVAA